MSVRVVARVRPLLKAEHVNESIVSTASAPGDTEAKPSIIRIPNPKKESEAFSFHFNSVYDQGTTQAEVFDNEVSPTVKHLFKGYDITLFAYGVTGTGKTHTMRGGKSLADRGLIPRLLSSIYRRARRIEKDSAEETQVEVSMSYYEIYNDRVYDLFEAPEKRTPAGLPIRDIGNSKTQVVGLTERPCTTLKEFEQLYDQANVNRSTSATKLNAHSSRSHAILCVKITQTTETETRVSTASAIDLAGSEDNRRTDNNKDRLVESASINKSLFVLAQCVEAISKKQARIPYRESKMTRILSLGQNHGITVMILNLAPVRSYHLDTVSSLNFANRTKKIEVNEIENQPIFRGLSSKGKSDGDKGRSIGDALGIHRQPLRPKNLSQVIHHKDATMNVPKPTKQFSVYSDRPTAAPRALNTANMSQARASALPLKSPKRTSSEAVPTLGRPSKLFRPNEPTVLRAENAEAIAMGKEAIEALIERKVNEALAERADQTTLSNPEPVPEEVQRRLEALEKRMEGQETERAEGLQYLLMAKQHQVRGEDVSALKMFQLAFKHFPENEKLVRKMVALKDRIAAKKAQNRASAAGGVSLSNDTVAEEDTSSAKQSARRRQARVEEDNSYHEDLAHTPAYAEEDDGFVYRPRTRIRRPQTSKRAATAPASEPSIKHSPSPDGDGADSSEHDLVTALVEQTPRTKHLLHIINTKDVSQIKLLRGVGAKKAEAIVNCLIDLDDDAKVTSLGQLGKLKGVGIKTVENMRLGLDRMAV
ncbi:hypothetical protein BAUCODRAFT_505953 [Baudoinia panamericana UAMH 10762]|uniref:Kinesin motor domain-containing protein n=1 Tax=Baudoinia panamericana (strain UAMH 10762) TaxID=717646 RepID=M2NAF6_BAUPA|nr:uncharacterized protein BAUCODRAFT_505953 [Baudoinia panamericana UAMH 10762]EMC95835.1 hypothetical protein BAUCODRAFT_505953 [Baudoinia panamericana UAMH 10762]